jgi:glycosyltransferase involved in cell wall biosynthesis
MPKLSILMPTISIDNRLIRAIDSVLILDVDDLEVVVSLNGLSVDERLTVYEEDPRLRIVSTGNERLPICESFNFALKQATGDWFFILSADDYLGPNFLKEVDLGRFNPLTLLTFPISKKNSDTDTEDEIKQTNTLLEGDYSRSEALDLFFEQKIHHHLSLFVFSRDLYALTTGYQNIGFPNGYYGDTLFHAKLLENCDEMRVINFGEAAFVRTISTKQESAKLYTDRNILMPAFTRLASEYRKLPHMYRRYRHWDPSIDSGCGYTIENALLEERLRIDVSKLTDSSPDRIGMIIAHISRFCWLGVRFSYGIKLFLRYYHGGYFMRVFRSLARRAGIKYAR